MVESAFNPMAYSHAHAAGLAIHFRPGQNVFNLEQDWWKMNDAMSLPQLCRLGLPANHLRYQW